MKLWAVMVRDAVGRHKIFRGLAPNATSAKAKAIQIVRNIGSWNEPFKATAENLGKKDF